MNIIGFGEKKFEQKSSWSNFICKKEVIFKVEFQKRNLQISIVLCHLNLSINYLTFKKESVKIDSKHNVGIR